MGAQKNIEGLYDMRITPRLIGAGCMTRLAFKFNGLHILIGIK